MAVAEAWERVAQLIWGRRRDYRQAFGTPEGMRVLADLGRVCRAHETTWDADPREHARAEGRREVFLWIARHVKLTDEEYWNLYGKELEA